MERLLKDAQAITGVEYDIDNLADVYTAIGVIQEKLGVAGTTAIEAEKTISGSAATMKAAWSNVLAAISGGGDLDRSIEELVVSIQKYFNNILPVVEKALVGIGTVISSAAPMLVQTVASAFIRALPQLISALWQMVVGLFQGIKAAVAELLSGKSIGAIEEQSKAISGSGKEQKKLTKEIKKTNKEISKSLAGFDEIQTISENIADSSDFGDEFSSGVSSAGAGEMNFDGSAAVTQVEDTFIQIMGKVSKYLIAIGAILLVTGNIGWGLGLILAGVVGSEYEEAQVGDGSSLSELLSTLGTVLLIAGIIAIVLGVLLCFAHMWGLGIKLISIGAVSVAAEVAINWDSIAEAFSSEKTAGWIAVIGIAAIAIGILLCFAQQWALGIGLIVVGAAAVTTVVAVNWNAITEKVKQVFTDFGGIIAAAGAAMIALGIILCCTGVGVGLGIGLIAVGAAAITGAVAANWDAIVGWVKDAWNAVKKFWNDNIAPVFTAKFWQDLANKCGNGLITGFEWAVNGIIGIFEKMINWIVDGLNKISITVPDWVPGIGGSKFGFNIPRASFGRVSIPRLAQGAVIPPNREFLAVLGDQKSGTNIEAPLDTIKQAVYEVLAGSGFGGGEQTIIVPLYLNDVEIARAVKEAGRKMGTQTVTGGFANAY